MIKILWGVLAFVAVLLVVGWAGLQVQPAPPQPHPERTRDRGTVAVPAGLPAPVQRYFEVTAGSEVPHAETAVVWGRARLKLPDARRGMWFPAQWKGSYAAGRGYRRDMDLTWFGRTVLRAADVFVGGRGKVTAGGRVLGAGPEVDQGANMTMWAEGIWMPSVLLTEPRVRWEKVDDRTARLVFPFGDGEDSVLCHFDPQSGLLAEITGLRYREPGGEHEPWRIEFTEWGEFQGLKMPAGLRVIWEEQGQPWAQFTVEGVEYNVDVSAAGL